MSGLDVPKVADTDFQAEAHMNDGVLSARLAGNADLRSKVSLDAFLLRFHAEAERLGVPEVTMDFRELRFMNSSCFKGFISWITTMQEMPVERQYKMRFLSNPTMHWQRRSLHALSCFATDHVSIET